MSNVSFSTTKNSLISSYFGRVGSLRFPIGIKRLGRSILAEEDATGSCIKRWKEDQNVKEAWGIVGHPVMVPWGLVRGAITSDSRT